MEGRISASKMALIVAMMASMAACAAPKPRPNKHLEEAAAERRAAQAVQEGVAKESAPARTAVKRSTDNQVLRAGDSIWIQSGKSRVLSLPYNVTRVSIGNPDLAGVVVLGPRSILINAKDLPNNQGASGGGGGNRQAGLLSARTFTPPPNMGETNVILWDAANHTDTHTVMVTDFLAEQVLLEVTIAELDRTKMEERGVDFLKLGDGVKAGYRLGGGAAIEGAELLGGLLPLAVNSERPTFAISGGDVTALVTMLQSEGLATVLAQPKIMALSGQNAVFQVGGEIPIRIVTSFSADVEFKAFGTLVNFLPRITDDGEIILTVTPEVSRPDFNSPVEGIPTFRTRRASTSAKLRANETLVIGGLVQHERIERERGLPYLKDIPYIGTLFRATSYTDETNELMIIVTPRLVRNLEPGTELNLPTDRGPLNRNDVKTAPDDATVTRPRLPTPAMNSQKPNR